MAKYLQRTGQRSELSSSRGLLDEPMGPPERAPSDTGSELAANAGAVGGMVISASVLWWATRAGGLVAAMMASVPAWRSFDPLPILVRERPDRRSPQPGGPLDSDDDAHGADAKGGAPSDATLSATPPAAPRTMLEEVRRHP